MTISSNTFISDIILFIRNLIRSNVTDPLSRTSGIGFVMSSYPKRDVQYPIITIKLLGMDSRNLGMQSEQAMVSVKLEVRVWARNAKEVDDLTQQVINVLRSNHYGTGSTDVEEIHGFDLTNLTAVNFEEGEDNIIHTKICTFQYKVIIG